SDDSALPQIVQPAAAAPTERRADREAGHGPGENRIRGALLVVRSAHVVLQRSHDDESGYDGAPAEPSAARQCAETNRERVFHRCSTRPRESSAASATASAIVGWAWMASSTSSTVYSFSRATASSWMSSDACPPTMCAPRISPYCLSRMIFTNPSVSPVPRARPFAENGKRPATYSTFRSLH